MLKFMMFPVMKFFARAYKYWRVYWVYRKLGQSDLSFKEFFDELHSIKSPFRSDDDFRGRVTILDETLTEVESLVPKDKKSLIEEIVQLREENAALREINLELRGE